MPVVAGYDGDSTFGSASFLVDEADALYRPAFDTKSTLVVTPIPYSAGNDWEIQVVGREPQRLALPLTLYAAQFTTLQGMVGTQATLTIHGDIARPNVMLESLTAVKYDDTAGLVSCTATWIGV